MKSLLVRLTVGLYAQDVTEEEKPLVEQWLSEGLVVLEEGVYRLPSQYRAGAIAMNQSGSGAYLQVLGANVRDLFIDEQDLGDAKEGDLVIVKRLLGRRGRPSAKLVAVVGRAETFSVAYIKIQNGVKSVLDIRNDYPAGVPLSAEALAGYEEGTLFKVNNQNGEIMEVLGNLADPMVDEKIVLAMYNKHDEFDDEVKKLAASFDKSVDSSKYPGRKDLRSLPFCTIDPVTAKDFDDAVCYLPESHTLYVAIADVSAYVTPFGPIDAEAIYRSFSIYLPHRSIPMLPRELSETLCSLQPHVDRLAYTFKMVLDPDSLEVVETELYETIIHSKRRFNYEEVDALFDAPDKAVPANDDEGAVIANLFELRKLTDALREKRLKVGFDFRSEELEMALDDAQNIVETTVAEETPSHALIEDCMLLANKAAAAMYERGVFRIHESPSPAKLQSLYTELAGIGIIAEQKESLKETITGIQHEAQKRGIAHEVDTLIIRSQMQARYAPDNVGHFGLGFERYTHFTSPIRRYSDLIVHRLLKAIARGDKEEGSYVLRNIDALCFAISDKEREASDIEVRFMDRKFARWANEHIGEVFPARVYATDPELRAEITGPLRGAKVKVVTNEPVMLFDDIELRIENVSLATARIHTTYVRTVESHATLSKETE
ncbi:ribonuclease R family protein [Thiomicrolovo sp. ZZH C-3]